MGAAVTLAVSGGLVFQAIGTGGNHTCGLTTGGNIYCWGRNYGQLGDGTTSNRTSPVAVSGGRPCAGVAACPPRPVHKGTR